MSAMPFTAKRPGASGGQGIDRTYLQTGISRVFLGFKPRKSLLLGTGHSYCIFNLVCQINADFLSV